MGFMPRQTRIMRAQLCLTACDPRNCGPPGSSVYGIFQARIMEWEHWSGLPLPPPGDLPNVGIKPESPTSFALVGRFFTTEPPGKPRLGSDLHYYKIPAAIWKGGKISLGRTVKKPNSNPGKRWSQLETRWQLWGQRVEKLRRQFRR